MTKNNNDNNNNITINISPIESEHLNKIDKKISETVTYIDIYWKWWYYINAFRLYALSIH